MILKRNFLHLTSDRATSWLPLLRPCEPHLADTDPVAMDQAWPLARLKPHNVISLTSTAEQRHRISAVVF